MCSLIYASILWGLADAAVYTYSKGGSDVSGPSIRLAEAMAQAWGNIQFGIRERDEQGSESTVQAYAWDVETNTRREITFQVPHVRYTRKGSYDLKDPREIYELVANQGARRLRACILAVIPGDVTEAAVAQCEVTMKSKADTSPEAMQKMVAAFAEFGVTKEQIEKRIQRRLDPIQSAQVVSLKKIYASLRDGMSSAFDWFENDQADSNKQTESASRTESVKAKAKAQREAALAARSQQDNSTLDKTVDQDGVVTNAPPFDYQAALAQIQKAPTLEKLDLLAEGLRDAPEDIRSGTRTAPSFRDAVALHETVDAIEHSAAGSEPK